MVRHEGEAAGLPVLPETLVAAAAVAEGGSDAARPQAPGLTFGANIPSAAIDATDGPSPTTAAAAAIRDHAAAA